jgi:hypothetical protein
VLAVPLSVTPRVQEAHVASYHPLCGAVEAVIYEASRIAPVYGPEIRRLAGDTYVAESEARQARPVECIASIQDDARVHAARQSFPVQLAVLRPFRN